MGNSTGSCTSRRGKGDPVVGAAFLALMSPCICCICYKNWRAKTYTYCRFCEVEVKRKLYKEHRENCFTENLDKIKGFKEAPLPKECPKDENHILYQWPDRKKNGSKFECEEPNCDNPDRIEVTKKSSKSKGGRKDNSFIAYYATTVVAWNATRRSSLHKQRIFFLRSRQRQKRQRQQRHHQHRYKRHQLSLSMWLLQLLLLHRKWQLLHLHRHSSHSQ